MHIQAVTLRENKFLNDLKKTNNNEAKTNPIKNMDKIASSEILTNYNKANISFKGKFSFEKTKENQQLILSISDNAQKAASVIVEYFIKRTEDDKNLLKEIVSTSKREQNGNFQIPIIPINRENNSFLEEIKLGKVRYYDLKGNEISEEKAKLIIHPKKEFEKTQLKLFSINNNERYSELEVVSNANTQGILEEIKIYEELKNYRGDKPIIVITDDSDFFNTLLIESMDEDFTIPSTVKGLIIKKPDEIENNSRFFFDALSHAKCRMDGKQAFVVVSDAVFSAISEVYSTGDILNINVNSQGIKMEKIEKLNKFNNKVELEEIVYSTGLLMPGDIGFKQNAVGIKAYNLGRLQELSKKEGSNFEVPKFFVIPPGEFEYIKKSNPLIYEKNPENPGLYNTYVEALDSVYDKGAPTDSATLAMRNIITKNMRYPKIFSDSLYAKIEEVFGNIPESLGVRDINKRIKQNNVVLSVRSSFPCLEDLDKVPSQGMFSSVGGVRAKDEVLPAVSKVWASKWSDRANNARREHSIPHSAVQPSVIVQEFVKDIDYMFTAYTGKIDDPNIIKIDLSKGVSNSFQGDPYIFEINKTTGVITRVTMATKGRMKDITCVDPKEKMNEKYLNTDYSKDILNLMPEDYAPYIKKIVKQLLIIEEDFGGFPQDIEGGIKWIKDKKGNIKDVKIHIWQTRNVQFPKSTENAE